MEKKVKASIITIGDELLIGQVVDTNSAWMAERLNDIGINVNRRVAVGDNREDIWQALEEEEKKSSIILITGGLGPTADDITKPLLCDYFKASLIVDQQALDNVKNIFENYLKRPLIERNLRQAEVPDNCSVLQNKRGTAPGMWFERNGVIYVSMPGVPFEMKGMMEADVLPKLKVKFDLPVIAHRTLLLSGIGESFVAEQLKLFEQELPPFIKLAYLPNYGLLRLRLSFNSFQREDLPLLDTSFDTLKSLVSAHLVIDEDVTLETAIARLLADKGKTVGTAESCTGGYIAHLLTSHAGASSYFKGAIVSYANTVKTNLLRVEDQTLEKYGAVSEQTIVEMARGALTALNTDFALATSGILGPDGGSVDKQVGTVWMAAVGGGIEKAVKMEFRFDRLKNMQLAATHALNLLRTVIIESGL